MYLSKKNNLNICAKILLFTIFIFIISLFLIYSNNVYAGGYDGGGTGTNGAPEHGCENPGGGGTTNGGNQGNGPGEPAQTSCCEAGRNGQCGPQYCYVPPPPLLPPAALHICPSSVAINGIAPGNTVLLKGYDTPAGTAFTGCANPNGTNRNDRYTWRSLNLGIATVNNNTSTAGLVTASTVGVATITADYAEVPGIPTATASITVQPVCAATHNNCLAGRLSGFFGEFPTYWVWSCNSGVLWSPSVLCTENKPLTPCNPTDNCNSSAQQTTAAATCTSDSFTFTNSCGDVQACVGIRACDYNWKEVAP